jgi:hypothetical protein
LELHSHASVFILIFRALWAVSNHNFIEAFGCQAAAVTAFSKAMQAMKDENWALPIMFVLCIDLRLFALSVSAHTCCEMHHCLIMMLLYEISLVISFLGFLTSGSFQVYQQWKTTPLCVKPMLIIVISN